MKKIFALSSVMFLVGTSMVMAENWSFVGNSEYQFEDETFELNAGAEYTTGLWTLTGIANTEKVSNSNYEFTGFTFGATVEATDNVDVYGVIETDGNVDYKEATIGVAFRY